MSNLIFTSKYEKIFFVAPGCYGANMKVDIFDNENGTFISKATPMEEAVHPVDDFSTTTTEDAVKDDKLLALDSTDGLSASERISVDGEIYRIIKVNSDNTVELHRGLTSDVASDTDVTRVGNMAVFSIKLYITTPGIFLVNATDTKYGIQLSQSLTVKEDSIEDMFNRTNIEINENERVIKETSGWAIII